MKLSKEYECYLMQVKIDNYFNTLIKNNKEKEQTK